MLSRPTTAGTANVGDRAPSYGTDSALRTVHGAVMLIGGASSQGF
jgi:hypothetical protein